MENTKGIDAAFPVLAIDKHGDDSYVKGLSKREYFAAMAMQGMLAQTGQPQCDPKDYGIGAAAVKYADDLIQALNQQPDK